MSPGHCGMVQLVVRSCPGGALGFLGNALELEALNQGSPKGLYRGRAAIEPPRDSKGDPYNLFLGFLGTYILVFELRDPFKRILEVQLYMLDPRAPKADLMRPSGPPTRITSRTTRITHFGAPEGALKAPYWAIHWPCGPSGCIASSPVNPLWGITNCLASLL